MKKLTSSYNISDSSLPVKLAKAASFKASLMGLRQKLSQKWLQTQIEKYFQLSCA
jgi:hypothetical protein